MPAPYEHPACGPRIPGPADVAAMEVALGERLTAVIGYAARITDLGRDYSIPESTLRAMMAKGIGPRTFRIGKLIYCRRADWIAWLDVLAESGGTGPLSPPAGRRAGAAPVAA